MADGDDLVIGKLNFADSTTELTPGLGLPGAFPTLLKVGHFFSPNASIGVHGIGITGIKGNGGLIGVDGVGDIGVRGTSGSQEGVIGHSNSGIGANGISRSNVGVQGESETFIGVRGSVGESPYALPSKVGVLGESNKGHGLCGHSFKHTGVVGRSVLGTGASGVSEAKKYGIGLYGEAKKAPDTYAGLFSGHAFIWGDLTKTGIGSSVAVRFPDRSFRLLYSIESPESWFEDFGEARLVKGKAEVKIDPDFAKTVNLKARYHVFVTPHSTKISGLAVVARSPRGFRVEHPEGGTGTFSYRIVAKRADVKVTRLKRVRLPQAISQARR